MCNYYVVLKEKYSGLVRRNLSGEKDAQSAVDVDFCLYLDLFSRGLSCEVLGNNCNHSVQCLDGSLIT